MAKFTVTVEVGQPRSSTVSARTGAPPIAVGAVHPSSAGPHLGSTLWSCLVWPIAEPRRTLMIVLVGLIGLIPYVGTVLLIGWMMDTVSRLHFGREAMPWPRPKQLVFGLHVLLVEVCYFGAAVPPLVVARFLEPGSNAQLAWIAAGVVILLVALVTLPANLHAIGVEEPFNVPRVLAATARHPASSIATTLVFVTLVAVAALPHLTQAATAALSLAPSQLLVMQAVLDALEIFLGAYAAAAGAAVLYRYVLEQA
jgi:hypothetical protein